MKADLHIHTTFSDGSFTLASCAVLAREKQLDVIAVTDHDTTTHFKYCRRQDEEEKQRGSRLKILPGIEISAWDYQKEVRVHILGYGIKDTDLIQEYTLPIREARHENSLKQIAVLKKNGFHIEEDKVPRAEGKYIYKQHIMAYLVSRGLVREMFGEFYQKTFKNRGICDFDTEYPSACEAVDAVCRAGGAAVLAHPGQQHNFDLIPKLAGCGLKGVELHHHSNLPADEQLVRTYARHHKLFLTGGSDFHGIYEAGCPEIGEYLSDESGITEILSLDEAERYTLETPEMMEASSL